MATPATDVVDLADLRLADSVKLFIDRAVAIDQSFGLSAANAAAVVDVCRRLDGVPLAIEMAAARTSVMSPEQIAASLGDRFELLVNPVRDVDRRHATLAATLDWSYELMSADAQRAFDRLSVFAGAFGIEDVAAVAVARGEGAGAVETIADLVESSMCSRVAVDPSRMRYRLLETQREYGLMRDARRDES